MEGTNRHMCRGVLHVPAQPKGVAKPVEFGAPSQKNPSSWLVACGLEMPANTAFLTAGR